MRTFINFVIDRSSSMASCRAGAISFLNEQIDTLKETKLPGTKVGFVAFNDSVSTLQDWNNLEDIQHINIQDYVPSGMTALLDGIGEAINSCEKEANYIGSEDAFLVIVITDGLENSSKEWTQEKLLATIKDRESTNQWTFVFMGDSLKVLQGMEAFSTYHGNAMFYPCKAFNGNIGTETSNSVSRSLHNYISLRNAGGTSSTNFFEEENK